MAKIDEKLVKAASNSHEVKELVLLARNIQRTAGYGPFDVEIPIHCSVFIEGKGWRKSHIPAGTRLRPGVVRLGKKHGLIFRFDPVEPLKRIGGNNEFISYIEMSWDDVINSVPGFAIQLGNYYARDIAGEVYEIDAVVRAAIQKNAAMYQILTEGFEKAQSDAKQQFSEAAVAENPLFGTF